MSKTGKLAKLLRTLYIIKPGQSEKLAEQLEMEFKEIELLLAGHLDIDQELSAKTEVFGNSAMFWLRLQRQYTALPALARLIQICQLEPIIRVSKTYRAKSSNLKPLWIN